MHGHKGSLVMVFFFCLQHKEITLDTAALLRCGVYEYSKFGEQSVYAFDKLWLSNHMEMFVSGISAVHFIFKACRAVAVWVICCRLGYQSMWS